MNGDPALARLAADLAAMDAVSDPIGWGVAAYRLGVARSEGAASADELGEAADLLRRAASVLSAERAPLEHARIRTALGSCARLAGRPDHAAAEFEAALALGRKRFVPVELAAAHANLGLALAECGHADRAAEVLDAGLAARLGDDDQARRARGALHLNRAQARQQLPGGLGGAIDDYRSAVELLPSGGPQRGMALHGLATALLSRGEAGPAVAALRTAVATLSVVHFPMQHAVARHSLAVAHERLGGDLDLRRALVHAEVAVRTFDPRLHRAAWTTASDTLSGLCASLGISTSAGDRARSFAALLDAVDADERQALLRDQLGRLVGLPPAVRLDELRVVVAEIAALEDPGSVVASLVSVLMELPDDVLDEACRALAEAGAAGGVEGSDVDRVVDEAVHDVLFGPQRVRVRDLLTSHGWVRP